MNDHSKSSRFSVPNTIPDAVEPVGSLDVFFENLMDGSLHLEKTFATAHSEAPLPAADACPDPEEWTAFAGQQAHAQRIHVLPNSQATAHTDAMLAHAALCCTCAERLRQALRLFSSETSPEESEEAAMLASLTGDWQRRMAVELAATPTTASAIPLKFYRWGGAALAASLVCALTLGIWWQHRHTPERLLAEAYTHSRVFDLRIEGADFATVSNEDHLRGGSFVPAPAALLEAKTRIDRQLAITPKAEHWLQLKARADLEEENFDAAIDILDPLLASGPVTASLLVDDATAYFVRGQITANDKDREMALNDLRRADEIAPSDPVVLFNEAIAMEDRGQRMNAVETWNRYLRFERAPRWQAEGRNRLEALEHKLNSSKPQ